MHLTYMYIFVNIPDTNLSILLVLLHMHEISVNELEHWQSQEGPRRVLHKFAGGS